jgi:hypothetical protein
MQPLRQTAAMIRPLLALARCLIAAGCQSDVPEETYDVNHPFDRVLVVHEPPLPVARRARENLEAHVEGMTTTRQTVDGLSRLRINCETVGRTLRCRYERGHTTRGKGLVQNWRVEFVADIDIGRRSGKVLRTCFTMTEVMQPPDTAPARIPTLCDPTYP